MAKAKSTDAEKTTKKPAAAKAAQPAAKKEAAHKPAAHAAPAAAKKETPAHKPAAKPATKSSAKSATPAPKPLIDTGLAASAAAAMIGNRLKMGAAAPSDPSRKESASFRQLKEGINNPNSLDSILGTGVQQKKSNQDYGGGSQTGRSQTFGAM